MKNASKLLVLFLLLSVFLISCTAQNFAKPEQINKAIDQIKTSTDKAISNKDLKLARSLWCEISEYGVKAGEMGEDELGDKLGLLASSYGNLVKYLETGDKEQFKKFQDNYTRAIGELESIANPKK